MNWIGDPIEDRSLDLFLDVDVAGCQATAKSTSGCVHCVLGPNSRFGSTASSKAQNVVSNSTPEAEIVSADLAVRTEALPASLLWDDILERDVKVLFSDPSPKLT